MQAGAAAGGMLLRNPPQVDAVNTQNPPFTRAAPAIVDTMQAPRFGHTVAVELEDAKPQLDSGSHPATVCPALYASERSAPEPEHAP
jgi:hypothetical protein